MGAFPTALIVDSDLVQSEFMDQATVGQVVANFDSTTGDIESLRTSVVSAFPTAQVRSIAEIEYDQSVSSREVRALAAIGLVIVLAIAAFSLSVGTASHLLQRRDAFAMLRASGVLPRQIRRLVALESTAPLAVSAAAGALLGVASGAAVATSAGTNPNVPWPTIGLVYLAAVLLGAVVWAAFAPFLDRLTSPTGLRFE
jgi:putative ABC transport system permease protein